MNEHGKATGVEIRDISPITRIDNEAKIMAERGNNKEYKLRENFWAVAIGERDIENADMDAIHRHIERLINEIMQNEMKENPIVSGNISVDGVNVTVQGISDMTLKEVRNYVSLSKALKCSCGENLTDLQISKGENNQVALSYSIKSLPFERIRRITGYLVGTIDRWNNAKKAEEKDRVKHIGSR